VTVPLALECNDLDLLKKVTARTDTVLLCPLAGAQEELAAQQLAPIAVKGLPVLGSNLGVVALKDRGLSPLARYVVDWLSGVGLPPF